MSVPLSDFDLALIAGAKARRDRILAQNEQCCGTCKWSIPPANPDHAPHYVMCQWGYHHPLPCHETPRGIERLMGVTSGPTCATYMAKEQAQ